MADPELDLVVIGGGSGGLVVAASAASLGAKVALVEKHKLGGDCLWYGCVPSKTLIKSAKIAQRMREADHFAISPHEPQIDLARVMDRVVIHDKRFLSMRAARFSARESSVPTPARSSRSMCSR